MDALQGRRPLSVIRPVVESDLRNDPEFLVKRDRRGNGGGGGGWMDSAAPRRARKG